MSNRTVFVFWDSDHDPLQTAEDYCKCVKDRPADGCTVNCRVIDTRGNDPAKKHWCTTATLEVVGVKDDVRQWSLIRPSFKCDDIRARVKDLCA